MAASQGGRRPGSERHGPSQTLAAARGTIEPLLPVTVPTAQPQSVCQSGRCTMPCGA
jgi:hypothetical protein